jgi:predicted RNA-binding protein Jag
MKHTPGPWKRLGRYIRAPYGERIATLNYIKGESNGRLIASAPQLLEALQMIAQVSQTNRHLAVNMNFISQTTRAAIKAAEEG